MKEIIILYDIKLFIINILLFFKTNDFQFRNDFNNICLIKTDIYFSFKCESKTTIFIYLNLWQSKNNNWFQYTFWFTFKKWRNFSTNFYFFLKSKTLKSKEINQFLISLLIIIIMMIYIENICELFSTLFFK